MISCIYLVRDRSSRDVLTFFSFDMILYNDRFKTLLGRFENETMKSYRMYPRWRVEAQNRFHSRHISSEGTRSCVSFCLVCFQVMLSQEKSSERIYSTLLLRRCFHCLELCVILVRIGDRDQVDKLKPWTVSTVGKAHKLTLARIR